MKSLESRAKVLFLTNIKCLQPQHISYIYLVLCSLKSGQNICTHIYLYIYIDISFLAWNTVLKKCHYSDTQFANCRNVNNAHKGQQQYANWLYVLTKCVSDKAKQKRTTNKIKKLNKRFIKSEQMQQRQQHQPPLDSLFRAGFSIPGLLQLVNYYCEPARPLVAFDERRSQPVFHFNFNFHSISLLLIYLINIFMYMYVY